MPFTHHTHTINVCDKSLENKEIFQNNSAHKQIPIDWQVFIALIRFESYGNRAFVSKIGFLYRVGYGIVDLVTQQVIIAIQSSNLGCEHIWWPSREEKEAAKNWVEEHAGAFIWQRRFCMANSTLIPLYKKPMHYGKIFFDCKMNYSINVQIFNTPNLQIIDYASGFWSSWHNNFCFESTRLA